MRREHVGRARRLVLAIAIAACLALLLPAAASAAKPPPEKYKVLVVTSAAGGLRDAGVSAIRAAGQSAGFSVVAPSPADVGDQFTAKKLEQYRSVVFLNTGAASSLSDAQRASFEDYYRLGGGFVGIGSAIETDPGWQFLTDVLGTRASGRTDVQSATVKVYDRVHDATKDLPEYWDRTDAWYNFAANVRGVSHVLDTVVEDPFGPQPQGNTLDGISGGTMGADHPISWCKDYKGGRSFYTGLGNTAASFDGGLTKHLKGAISWAAGVSDPVYSDCGATVLKNYQQVKVSGPPNLSEPIAFDQFPDGRVIQTDRRGGVHLHDPVTGTSTLIANLPVYTVNEDGLYGPGVDRNFSSNHWVYLYYAPPTVEDVKLSDGSIVTQTTPTNAAPNTAASFSAWDPYVGYFQLSRFKFVDDAPGVPAHLDMSSEQQILRVSNNRGACCHVAGDIDFDKHNNLWIVTGDDSPAGGGNSGGFGPFNAQKTDETQTVRVTNATGGAFTLAFDGQTTAPIAFNANAAAIQSALEALGNIAVGDVTVTGQAGSNVSTANQTVLFKGAFEQVDVAQMTGDSSGLTGTGTPALTINTTQQGNWWWAPHVDSRRSALNTNDLRGKLLRFHVKDGDIAPADENHADFGSGGAYSIPSGNLFPLAGGQPQARTRPEVYAMGFRNPFRVQVDENDVAYVSDYSPDSQVPQQFRGPAGTGRYEIVRHPANYGWPICYRTDLGYYRWNFNTTVPLDATPTPFNCAGATVANESHWNLEGGPAVEPGRADVPPITNPDIWYSYRDNNAATPLGTPCFGNYGPTALTDPPAPGSTTPCPRLFPELYTGGVGPHGIAKYHYDPANPNPKKFPPYYDNSVILGEFTQDTMREAKLDSQNRIFKVNKFLDCGQALQPNPAFPFECDNPMDMQWGADGSFYLLTYGDGFFNINLDAGMYRWDYVKGTRPPKAVLTTDRTDGPTPLTVNFSSAGSLDEDPADSIRFEWDFGDGSAHSIDPNPQHVYTAAGRYTAVLTVTDSSGKQTATSTTITVGNTSPTVVVNTPVDGGTFAFGENIPFTVTVTDPEDGAVNCAEVQVTFVLGHDTHGHAEETTTGCSGTLHTSADDVSHGGNVFGVVSASYTDHGGPGGVPTLSTTGQNQIRQKHQEVEFAVSQSGTNTATNTDGGPTPPGTAGVHRGSLGAGDWIQLNGPFNLVNINSVTFRVADAAADRTPGSPLAAIEVRQDAPNGPVVTTANLTSTGGTGVWSSQTVPISLSGKHELFLVFQTVTGGATGGNLFNLNWAEFTGQGIGVSPT
jgi:PKD repeat protein/glucose/arabinose dehydrogenase